MKTANAGGAQKWVFVRHGETEWTEKGLLHGRLDSPLSPAGLKHAKLAADRLRGECIDVLYTSPSGRALQTASILGEVLGLAPTVLDGLREMDFGWAEGKSLQIVDPAGPDSWLFRQLARIAMAATAERASRFAARVSAALETARASYPQGNMLFVTHWGVLSMIKALLFDGGTRRWRDNGPWAACGITELQLVNGSWQVICLNDQTHFEEKR